MSSFSMINKKGEITEAVSVAQGLCFVIAPCDQKFALSSVHLASSQAVWLIKSIICDSS